MIDNWIVGDMEETLKGNIKCFFLSGRQNNLSIFKHIKGFLFKGFHDYFFFILIVN